jgi:hypothetical protein
MPRLERHGSYTTHTTFVLSGAIPRAPQSRCDFGPFPTHLGRHENHDTSTSLFCCEQLARVRA